ncbi:MAG TPA: response regulator, partial [Candidatus Limnocylindria bacterium]|nr:response regulator [Candidatus Limnocylindria bacterium]
MSERRKRILVIDDEPMICELLQWILRSSYDVQTEEDSLKGFETAQISSPDLILCDLTMPRLSGPALIARLLAEPRTAHVPVLLVSGDVSV